MGEIDLSPTCTVSKLPAANSDITLREWVPVGEPKSRALLIHGLGAHSGWFEATGRRLAARQILAISYDHCGFGTRKQESLKSYSQWITDLCLVYEQVSRAGTAPMYLMANSMGALLAIAALKREPQLFFGKRAEGSAADGKPAQNSLSGLAVFSPGFDGYPGTFTLPFKMKAILTALLSPNTQVTLPYGPDSICRDQYVQRWISEDPDHVNQIPAGMLLELLKLSREIEAVLPLTVPVPVLMLTAGIERIVNNRVNEKFFKGLTAPHKHWKQFDQAYHDLMFDPLLDDVVSEVYAWQANQPSQLLTGQKP